MRNAAQIHLARSNGGNAIVAANVRAELGRAGLKQGALADVLGLSEMAVSRRLGDTTEFTAGEIVLLAEFFAVSPGDLFFTRTSGTTRPDPAPAGGGRTLAGVIPLRRSLGKLPGLDSNQEPIG